MESRDDALRGAALTIAATVVNFLIMLAICTSAGVNASPAVLSAAITVGLMRRPEHLSVRSLLTKFVTLPLVALAAGLIAISFLRAPILGAALFTGGIALSIWLRNYGDFASIIGRTIAMPLVAILVVPVHVDATAGKGLAIVLAIAAGLVAFVGTTVAMWVADRLSVIVAAEPARKPKPQAQSEGTIPVATRMALQMLVALSLAFAVGFLVFRSHWPWVVLTAFIVTSGAVGRGDAIYKGLLRLIGAIGGTLTAAFVALITFPNPSTYAAVVFIVLFLGIWLRQVNYAYWAACATLIFALLQGAHGESIVLLAGMRILGIIAGALCGVAATWFFYPIRTEQVVRRRVADALIAVREFVTGEHDEAQKQARLNELDGHAMALERIAPPVRLHRAVFAAKDTESHPATMIDAMRTLLERVRSADFDRAQAGAEMRRVRDMLAREGSSRGL